MEQYMNKQHWANYLETPRRTTKPVKIDIILRKRMQTFMKMKFQALQMDED
jgi:hypothetical protein